MKHWVQHPIRTLFFGPKIYSGYGNVHFKLKSTKRFNLSPVVLFDYFLDKDYSTCTMIDKPSFLGTVNRTVFNPGWFNYCLMIYNLRNENG